MIKLDEELARIDRILSANHQRANVDPKRQEIEHRPIDQPIDPPIIMPIVVLIGSLIFGAALFTAGAVFMKIFG